MITRNILSKLYFHPLFLFIAFICALTGNFKEFTIFFLLIIIHELGHIIGGLYYNWNIEKIIILPFGGITIFNIKLNTPLKEEFIVTILGPMFQMIFYILCINLFFDNVILTRYHYPLLIFNLIPIIPLDGSKIFNIIFNKIFCFKNSHLLSILISCLIILSIFIIVIYNNYGLIYILMFLFLIIKTISEIKSHKQLINKFVLERYLYNFKFKNIKIIKNKKINNMFKDKKHFFYLNDKLYEESAILKKMFDFKGIL